MASSLSTMPRTPLLLHTLLDRGARLQPNNLLIERTVDHGYSSTSYAEHAVLAKVSCEAPMGAR
jgi:hypothetical protein